MLAEADDDGCAWRNLGDGGERFGKPLLVVTGLLLARQRAAQRFMRDDKGRGVALGLGDAGDAPRHQAIDAGQTRKEVPLKPGRRRLVQADMEVHAVRPEASSAKAAALTLQCDAVRNSDQVGQASGGLPPHAKLPQKTVRLSGVDCPGQAPETSNICPWPKPMRAVSMSALCLPGGLPRGDDMRGN